MTLAYLSDPADPRVVRAVDGWSCDLCGAPRNEPCRNTIRPGAPLPGRVVHIGRLTDRRREAKEDS